MVGTATFLALWVLTAAPGNATASSDDQDNLVQVIFQEQNPLEDEKAEKRAQRSLPMPEKPLRDLAYEDKTVPPAPSQEGIPGLAPLEDDDKPEKPKDAPKYKDDVGEMVCSDEPTSEPCRMACEQTRDSCGSRRGWLRDICVDAWIDQGVTINTLSPQDRSNGTVTFNNRSNEYQLNQSYLRFRRDIDEECDAWQMGGRVDMLYGTDSYYTSARGLEVYGDLTPKWNAQQYGLSMPQAYMELYAPWGNGVSMKLGHFYSMFGYETVTAPDNFFYSHAYAFQYGEPFTYTGFLGSTKLGNFTLEAGMTRGWNNWENDNNNLGFTGGIRWKSSNERTSVSLNVDAGREQPDGSTNTRSAYSLVIQQKFRERWQYVFQHDFGSEPGAGIDGGVANWYGLNQYFLYTINETWKAGMRYEWFRDEGGARVPGFHQAADYFELSAGLNWTPNERVIVRPELRWDFTTTADCNPFGDGTRSSQILLDCDVIVKF